MKDKLVSNIHLFFLLYALMLGADRYELLTGQLETAINNMKNSLVKLKKVEKDLKDLKRFESNLEESKNRVREVVARMEKVQRQLPSEINDAKVSGSLTEMAYGLKMLDPSPSPGREEGYNFYAAKDFNFDAKGTFLQFLIFFEQLEKLADDGRILNVKYLRFFDSNAGDDRSRFKILNLTTTVEAYRYTSFDKEGTN